MSEDQELLERISSLAGHINRHKNQTSDATGGPQENGYGRHWTLSGGATSSTPRPPQQYTRGYPSYHHHRGGYGRGRVRGYQPVHKNRTLVLNNSSNTPNSGGEGDMANIGSPDTTSGLNTPNDNSGASSGWIAKRDRHMQLINPAIYDKETQARAKAMEETRRVKARQRDEREKAKIARHLQRLTGQTPHPGTRPSLPSTPSATHEISIHDIKFRVCNGGSKLVKVSQDPSSAKTTPKTANVGGVIFHRSKNGNLYRSGLIKAQRSVTVTQDFPSALCEGMSLEYSLTCSHRSKTGQVKKIPQLCRRFTTTGTCLKGPSCPYIHDPSKVAICKTFLQTGKCPAGDACDLSHDPKPERVPACLHFLRGKCSNPGCRYAHVKVSPGAPVCRDFAILGYCEKGSTCPERHVHECPDYANTGTCPNKKCHLPHVDRAGQIRKTATQTGHSTEDEESDTSSEEEDYDEIDSDDVDSDGLDEEMMPIPQGGQDLDVSQQRDFIHL